MNQTNFPLKQGEYGEAGRGYDIPRTPLPHARAAGTEAGCGLVGGGWQGGCSKGSAICLLFVSYLFAICSQIQIQSQINRSPLPNPKLHPPCHQDTSRIPPGQARQGWSPGEGGREGGCSRGVAIDFLLTSY